MPKLSVEERSRLIGHLQAGCCVSAVSKTFNISRSSVYRLQGKYGATGTVKDLPRQGRPRVTQEVEDANIVLMHEGEPFKTAVETASEVGSCSRHTVRRRLLESGLRARRPAVRPMLSAQHRLNRHQWAREHLRWTCEQWSRVLFSDEAAFQVDQKDGRIYCYRRRNERFSQRNIQEVLNKGYGTVSVWGGIVGGKKTHLVRINGRLDAQQYILQVLQPYVVPFLQNPENTADIFVQDNAPPHRAHVTQEFLRDNAVETLAWPSLSPDMNPVEHMWSMIKRALKRRDVARNADELFAVVNELWHAIPADVVRNLTQSTRRRVRSLYEAEGGHTKY